jgi:hypothetical protein
MHGAFSFRRKKIQRDTIDASQNTMSSSSSSSSSSLAKKSSSSSSSKSTSPKHTPSLSLKKSPECLHRFRSYKKVTRRSKDGTPKGWKKLEGLVKKNDERYIYPILTSVDDYDRVDWNNPIRIPSSYERESSKKESHTKQIVCRVPRPLPRSLRKLDEVGEFIQNAKPYWIQAKDIRRMKHGETAELVNFHRNTGDVIYSGDYKQRRAYTPSYLFKGLRITYQHDRDLHGWIIADADGVVKHKGEPMSMTWDIRVKNRRCCMWRAPKKNESVSGNTYVGIRGPVVFWDDIKTLPRVYYDLKEGLLL